MSLIWFVIKAWFAWFILAPLFLVSICLSLSVICMFAAWAVDKVQTWRHGQ